MAITEQLQQAFQQFISNQVSQDLLREIVCAVSLDDVDSLMASVEDLDDPDEYCESDYDDRTITGYFLFIDFISALIIHLGDSAIAKASSYADAAHPYTPWIARYTGDVRFHAEIMAKFEDAFAA